MWVGRARVRTLCELGTGYGRVEYSAATGTSEMAPSAAPAPSGASADMLTIISRNEAQGVHFGTSVSGIPDVNGDGLGDFIVGAPGEFGMGIDTAGRAYIFSGLDGSLIRAHSSPNAVLDGRFGQAVSGVPDLNNDGRGDYIIGATGELAPGRGRRICAVSCHPSEDSIATGGMDGAIDLWDARTLELLGTLR